MKFLPRLSLGLIKSSQNTSELVTVGNEVVSQSLLRRPPTEAQHTALVCFDTSTSMFLSGAINELRPAVPKFLEQMRGDYAIRASVLMAWGTFGRTQPLELSGPFTSVDELKAPEFQDTGDTPLNARIVAAIDLLCAGRRLVQNVLHLDQGRAMLIEMTDGDRTDPQLDAEARKAIQVTAVENNIDVHLFAVGDQVNDGYLASLAQPGRPVQKLCANTDFVVLFNWIRHSLAIKSRSMVGQEPEIPSFDEFKKGLW